jgi:hypothetical protein
VFIHLRIFPRRLLSCRPLKHNLNFENLCDVRPLKMNVPGQQDLYLGGSFRLKTPSGLVRKIKALKPGRRWFYLDELGNAQSLPDELCRHAKLTQAQGGIYAATLENGCDYCKQIGKVHSKSCTRPRHNNVAAPESKSDRKQPTLKAFTEGPGARTATVAANARANSTLGTTQPTSVTDTQGESKPTLQKVIDLNQKRSKA